MLLFLLMIITPPSKEKWLSCKIKILKLNADTIYNLYNSNRISIIPINYYQSQIPGG
jgi:hypothetical protein